MKKNLLLITSLLSAIAFAQGGNENWASNFTRMGTNGSVQAIESIGNDVFVSGSFNSVGGIDCWSLGKWNTENKNWYPILLPGEIAQYSNILSLKKQNSNSLIVGGSFNSILLNSSLRNIAAYSPLNNSWSSLGAGVNGDVRAIAISLSGEIFVGGTFTYAFNSPTDSIAVKNIAMWNGTSWSNCGGGVNGPVYALEIKANDIFVGGKFYSSGGNTVFCYNIAKYDFVSGIWSAVSNGVDANGFVNALKFLGNDLYVGGKFEYVSNSSTNNLITRGIAKWNGNSWDSLSSGVNYDAIVYSIGVYNNHIIIGGNFHTVGRVSCLGIAEWNGASWSAIDLGLHNQSTMGGSYTYAINTVNNLLFAGGLFLSAGGSVENFNIQDYTECMNIAFLSEGKWIALSGGPNNNVDCVTAIDSVKFVVGGRFTSIGGTGAKKLAVYDSNTKMFSDIGFKGKGGTVYATAHSGGNIFAAGDFISVNNDTSIKFLAKYNGNSWSGMGISTLTTDEIGTKGTINTICLVNNLVYIGGQFKYLNGIEVNSIAVYDGATWQGLTGGIGNVYSIPVVYAIIFADPFLIIGGNFTHVGGSSPIYARSIAKWNGAWNNIGNFISNYPYATAIYGLTFNQGILYAGGYFSGIGSVSALNVAKWDGINWSSVGSGLTGFVSSIIKKGDNLFACGSIASVNFITKFDGQNWLPLGSGLDAGAVSIASANNKILVGGAFVKAGNKSSYKLAMWTDDFIPVELTSFTASVKNNNILLEWQTSTEKNNSGFEIQKRDNSSADKSNWKILGFVVGQGTTNGKQNYSFEDKLTQAGSFSYRLRQVDFDGTSQFSSEVEVNFGLPTEYMLYQNYPNPFNPTTKIRYSIPLSTDYQSVQKTLLRVYDILGREVATLVNEELSAGEYEVEFDGSFLSSGFYIYELRSGNFVERRKMILVR